MELIRGASTTEEVDNTGSWSQKRDTTVLERFLLLYPISWPRSSFRGYTEFEICSALHHARGDHHVSTSLEVNGKKLGLMPHRTTIRRKKEGEVYALDYRITTFGLVLSNGAFSDINQSSSDFQSNSGLRWRKSDGNLGCRSPGYGIHAH